MKPAWNGAPLWANFLARDKNGNWCWYEKEPFRGEECWYDNTGHWCPADEEKDWAYSLEARPQKEGESEKPTN